MYGMPRCTPLLFSLLTAHLVFAAPRSRQVIFEEWPCGGSSCYVANFEGGAVRLTSRGIEYVPSGGSVTMAPAASQPLH